MISTTPPALPGQMYPVLKTLDDKVTVLEGKVSTLQGAATTPQTFTAPNNAVAVTLGLGQGSTIAKLSFAGIELQRDIGDTAISSPSLWLTPGAITASTPNNKFAVTTVTNGLELQYKDSGGATTKRDLVLTSDGKLPCCSLTVTQYAVGTGRTFTTLTTQGGITTTTSAVTLTKAGQYKFSLSAATDTPSTVGGFWALKNGTRIGCPALLYGLYNLSATGFIATCAANDIITFEIVGTTLWNSSGSGFQSNQVIIELVE